jgi:hypothetical protein
MRLSLFPIAFATVLLAQQASFVPADFQVPQSYKGSTFQLRPLGPDIAELDYKAYMSSIEHLQKTFSHSTRWPTEKLTMEDQAKDMAGEKSRFDARKSFTYAVLNPAGDKELGCVYISPSRKEGSDATVRIWVIKEEYDKGFESTLIPEVKKWLAEKWPFQHIAFPGRDGQS